MRALILKNSPTGPPGHLAEWCAERGIEATVLETETGRREPDLLDGIAFLACLGSPYGPRSDPDATPVVSALTLMRGAIERDIPVLGICFGSQALAVALGGDAGPAPEPERGWIEVESSDPAAIPTGPWLAWHRDRFTVPPGATEIAANAAGPQAFRRGRHLGVQFHPEATVATVSGWAERDGVDPAPIHAQSMLEPAAAANARVVFDSFLAAV